MNNIQTSLIQKTIRHSVRDQLSHEYNNNKNLKSQDGSQIYNSQFT